MSQGLKPASMGVGDVRAKARTYLRGNGKSNDKNRSRFPAGMTKRKARTKADSLREWQKEKQERKQIP